MNDSWDIPQEPEIQGILSEKAWDKACGKAQGKACSKAHG